MGPMSNQRIPGFRLGIYGFKDAEIVDFAAPHGVFSVARRFNPELDAFPLSRRRTPSPRWAEGPQARERQR